MLPQQSRTARCRYPSPNGPLALDTDALVDGDAIVGYTAVLTRNPGAVTADHIDALRSAGLSDADIVALNNLSAY